MHYEQNIWIIGGDMRQVKLAQLLAEDGHTVHTFALEKTPAEESGGPVESDLAQLHRADCIILPLPVSGEGGHLNTPLSDSPPLLADLLDRMEPHQLLFGGKVDPAAAKEAEARGLIIRDYLAREELAVANAVPAVSAVAQPKGHTPPTPWPLSGFTVAPDT